LKTPPSIHKSPPGAASSVPPQLGGSLEPVRLLAGGGSAFERRLLEAAQLDRMPSASRQQLAQALQVPNASAPAGLLRSLTQAARVWKYGAALGLGAVGVLAALTALRGLSPTLAEQTPEPALASAPMITATPPGAARSSAPPILEAEPRLNAASGTHTASPRSQPGVMPLTAVPHRRAKAQGGLRASASPTPATKPKASTTASSTTPSLGDELRALEAIQHTLHAGRADAADRALHEYTRRFPGGELAIEAQLLAVDVALARGQQTRASTLARQLLALPGAARYRERLQGLTLVPARAPNNASRGGVNSPGLHIDGPR
jgi:hypothetical protein